MLHGSFMSTINTIVVPGGKLGLADGINHGTTGEEIIEW